MNTIRFSLLTMVAGLSACSFAARSPEMYRDDTAALMETRGSSIKACYDQALAANTALSGQVTVTFTVEHDTGQLTNVQADPAGTTAPPELAQCVVSSLSGLTLAPPDKRDGMATFVYDFSVGAAPPPEPAPEASDAG